MVNNDYTKAKSITVEVRSKKVAANRNNLCAHAITHVKSNGQRCRIISSTRHGKYAFKVEKKIGWKMTLDLPTRFPTDGRTTSYQNRSRVLKGV